MCVHTPDCANARHQMCTQAGTPGLRRCDMRSLLCGCMMFQRPSSHGTRHGLQHELDEVAQLRGLHASQEVQHGRPGRPCPALLGLLPAALAQSGPHQVDQYRHEAWAILRRHWIWGGRSQREAGDLSSQGFVIRHAHEFVRMACQV